jgi:predicted GIY-YIG superfamily endonuclease
MLWVYVLGDSRGRFYIGLTDDLPTSMPDCAFAL